MIVLMNSDEVNRDTENPAKKRQIGLQKRFEMSITDRNTGSSIYSHTKNLLLKCN